MNMASSRIEEEEGRKEEERERGEGKQASVTNNNTKTTTTVCGRMREKHNKLEPKNRRKACQSLIERCGMDDRLFVFWIPWTPRAQRLECAIVPVHFDVSLGAPKERLQPGDCYLAWANVSVVSAVEYFVLERGFGGAGNCQGLGLRYEAIRGEHVDHRLRNGILSVCITRFRVALLTMKAKRVSVHDYFASSRFYFPKPKRRCIKVCKVDVVPHR